ncbi:hypothetical protein WG909_13205 [Peptostreptococcaceae bacterium AGR-M142]
MADYLAYRIIEGAYSYEYVIERRPEFQEGINAYLIKKGREDLIPEKYRDKKDEESKN